MNIDLRIKIRGALIKHSKGLLNLNTEEFLDETIDIINSERKKLPLSFKEVKYPVKIKDKK